MISGKLPELFDKLEIKLRPNGNYFFGNCAVHGGDNQRALNVFPEGEQKPGYWVCHTHHCEKVFYPSIIGFTRGVLSHKQFGYSGEGDGILPFWEVVDFLCDFIGQPFRRLKIDLSEVEKRRFLSVANTFGVRTSSSRGWSPHLIWQRMECPSKYFLGRGYSPHVLERFSVGDWTTKDESSAMWGRAVCPVFDVKKRYVVGVTGRSTFPHCKGCDCYHIKGCPPLAERWKFSKWRNNDGFPKKDYFYGLWNAQDVIRSSGKVLLVESPGNVLRASEAGIDNCVGLLGTELSESQQILLEASGAFTIFLCMDNDAAGEAATSKLESLLSKCFRVKRIKDVRGDLGEMGVGEVKSIIVPQMR